jgi:tRNA(Met) C34 N-acetyltransferase TmcA
MHQQAIIIVDEAAAIHLQLTDYYKQVYANLPDWQRVTL